MVIVLKKIFRERRKHSLATGRPSGRIPVPPSRQIPRPVAPPIARRPAKVFIDLQGRQLAFPASLLPVAGTHCGKRDHFHRLQDLFAHPDEVWQVAARQMLRYLKFHNEYLLAGAVDMSDPRYLKIIDWCVLDYGLMPHERPCGSSITELRTGELMYDRSIEASGRSIALEADLGSPRSV